MPNFKIHQITNYFVLICIIISLFIFYRWNDLVPFFIIGFYIGTNYITPDLDINSKPSNNKVWWLYKKMSKHRGKTHSLVFGFMFPLIYIIIMILIGVGIIGYIMNDNEMLIRFVERCVELSNLYYKHFISFIGGIGIANGIHIIHDKLN